MIRTIVAFFIFAGTASAFAQGGLPAPPQNVVQLSASGSVDVPQDLLTLSMNTTRDGPDAGAVQAQLAAALDAALALARKEAQPGQFDVRTGNFNLHPRYARDGKPAGWQGSVELTLEGRDFVRLTATAGKIQTLTVGGVSFGLSREQRAKAQAQAQGLAIERFKARAQEIAQAFGFGGYTLREVAVDANEQGPQPQPRFKALEARAAMADAPIPVEAGKSTVVVSVAGSVQLK